MPPDPTSPARPGEADGAAAPSGRSLGAGRRWGLLLGAWALLGLVFVGPIVAQAVAESQGVPWSKVLSELLGWYLWAALFPPIAALCRRWPLTLERRAGAFHRAGAVVGRLALHLAAGVVVSAAYVLLSVIKNEVVTAAFTGRFSPAAVVEAVPATVPAYLWSGLEFYLLVYFAIVAMAHAVRFYEDLRDRERRASELAAQLAAAQLRLLRMQLHPHFLFNTLNAISALMHRDVDAADRAIALLSDLLRFSLEEDERHQAPLRRELEILDRYLQIERLRFADRLTVEIDVPGECLVAQVPRLILQPLVENSIRHAVAVRSAAGRIVVSARRQGDRLLLQVRDDGPGLAAKPTRDRPGVGLANTRARLAQLYGDDQRFALVERPDGVTAEIDMPFEEAPRRPAAGGAAATLRPVA